MIPSQPISARARGLAATFIASTANNHLGICKSPSKPRKPWAPEPFIKPRSAHDPSSPTPHRRQIEQQQHCPKRPLAFLTPVHRTPCQIKDAQSRRSSTFSSRRLPVLLGTLLPAFSIRMILRQRSTFPRCTTHHEEDLAISCQKDICCRPITTPEAVANWRCDDLVPRDRPLLLCFTE